jgi:hypothetical protein
MLMSLNVNQIDKQKFYLSIRKFVLKHYIKIRYKVVL